jgi:hypothetical protein
MSLRDVKSPYQPTLYRAVTTHNSDHKTGVKHFEVSSLRNGRRRFREGPALLATRPSRHCWNATARLLAIVIIVRPIPIAHVGIRAPAIRQNRKGIEKTYYDIATIVPSK